MLSCFVLSHRSPIACWPSSCYIPTMAYRIAQLLLAQVFPLAPCYLCNVDFLSFCNAFVSFLNILLFDDFQFM